MIAAGRGNCKGKLEEAATTQSGEECSTWVRSVKDTPRVSKHLRRLLLAESPIPPANVVLTCGPFLKLLPRWVIVLGLVLALAGELSWLHLAFPKLLFLIPLVRFPGFIWLIAVGFLLPRSRAVRAA